MKHVTKTSLLTVVLAILILPATVLAHGGGKKNIRLHVDPTVKECSFRLDSSLTQRAWSQFTQEAGIVTYFRPLISAKPMGAGRFELSLLQWGTSINEADAAWNNTFVHPDSTHWLTHGKPLAFPGLMFRVGVTDRLDVGAYLTKSPGSNYGFWGGQVQYSMVQAKGWDAAARISFVSMYGPKDLDFTVYGADLVVSREYKTSGWSSVSPYAGLSTFLATSHEKTAAVELKDENRLGVIGTMGVVAQVSRAQLAVEYGISRVQTLSFKLGVSF